MTDAPTGKKSIYLGADLITDVIIHLKATAAEGKMPQSFSGFVADAVREKLEREDSDASS